MFSGGNITWSEMEKENLKARRSLFNFQARNWQRPPLSVGVRGLAVLWGCTFKVIVHVLPKNHRSRFLRPVH